MSFDSVEIDGRKSVDQQAVYTGIGGRRSAKQWALSHRNCVRIENQRTARFAEWGLGGPTTPVLKADGRSGDRHAAVVRRIRPFYSRSIDGD